MVLLCPLCERENMRPSDHHLVPKSRGGKHTLTICSDCHRAIHARFENKELEAHYNTVEALLADEQLAKTIRFISKQHPLTITPTKTSKRKRNKGR